MAAGGPRPGDHAAGSGGGRPPAGVPGDVPAAAADPRAAGDVPLLGAELRLLLLPVGMVLPRLPAVRAAAWLRLARGLAPGDPVRAAALGQAAAGDGVGFSWRSAPRSARLASRVIPAVLRP